MKFIDLHADTASLLYKNEDGQSFIKNCYCVDEQKLRTGNAVVQDLAMFYNLNKVRYIYSDLYKVYIEMINNTVNLINESKELFIAKTLEDIENNENNNKISIIISIEDGGILDNDISKIDELYDMGIRIITLTWNYDNCIGFPNNYFNFQYKGLTEFGKEVVRKMNEKGIIIDVSHLSDEGFYDVTEISRKPFIASHSNARAICKSIRNLKDDMIKIIANKGGTIGINFFKDFISNEKVSNLELLCKHISHIKNIGGIDCISIGTDFDGFEIHEENMPIKNTGEVGKLADYLSGIGFTTDEIEHIFYKNAMRVFKEVLN